MPDGLCAYARCRTSVVTGPRDLFFSEFPFWAIRDDETVCAGITRHALFGFMLLADCLFRRFPSSGVFDPVTRTVVCEVIFGTNTSNVCFGKGGAVWVTGLGHLWRLTRKL